MPSLGRFARELRARLWKPSVDEEVQRELRNHIELLEADLVARGLEPAAAHLTAREKFGDVGRIADVCRDIGELRDREARRSEWLAEAAQDVRFALRQLRANRRFALVAVLTLAVGLGATTTIFGIANAVLLRPFPVVDAGGVVLGLETTPTGRPFSVSEPDYLDWTRRVHSVAAMAAFSPRTPTIRSDDGAEQLVGVATTHAFFSVLGVAPALGRPFTAEEDVPGGDRRVVVIGHSLWERRFGGDPSILGVSIELDGIRHRIVGVMPNGFDFPRRSELWMPLAPSPTYHRGDRRLTMIARLKPGVTVAQAGRELSMVAGQIATEHPASNARWSAQVTPFAEWYIAPQLQARVFALLATVGLLLVMACVNVASLLLARAGSREREMAVRSALGAGRRRILRQLLTESLVLSIFGSAIGLAIAAAAIPVIRSVGSVAIPRLDALTLDWRVLTFAVGTCLTTGILFGLAPALHLARPRARGGDAVLGVIRGGSRTTSGGRLGGTLVVTSVAMAMLLLVSAGLVGGSFVRLMRVTLGFAPEHVLTASVTLPDTSQGTANGRERVTAFFSALTQRLGELPGVRDAGAISIAPFSGGNPSMAFEPVGSAPEREGEYRLASWRVVTPGLLSTLGIPLVRGRAFDNGDRYPAPDVVLISESMARLGWPGGDPIGRQAKLESGRVATVVGIVGDTRHVFPDSAPPPTMYFAHAQFAWRSMWIAVRTVGEPTTTLEAVRREVAALDPAVALARVQPLTRLVRDTTAEPRLTVLVFAIFASAALVLAAIGLYGIVSYTVSQRTREIGVRIALGAQPRRIQRAVLNRGMTLAALGVAIGGVAGYGAAGALRSILFETEPTDGETFMAIAALLLLVAGIASLLPARRASRVDPLVALRSD